MITSNEFPGKVIENLPFSLLKALPNCAMKLEEAYRSGMVNSIFRDERSLLKMISTVLSK
jgi:hypothetical protein